MARGEGRTRTTASTWANNAKAVRGVKSREPDSQHPMSSVKEHSHWSSVGVKM